MSYDATKLPAHSPPGKLDDLSAENKNVWSEKYINAWMEQEISANPPLPGPCGTKRTPLAKFFNGTRMPFDVNQTPATVTWNAFPNIIKQRFPSNATRWAIADYSRMVQDEYCEWSTLRVDDKIIKVTFTCEGPEYWRCIADWQGKNPRNGKSVFQLYKELNPGHPIEESDLYLVDANTKHTVYNPLNVWNCTSTSGTIAHLIHPANTLSAEVDLAAQATVIRMDKDGNLITNPIELIECSKYGQPQRNSDPHIGSSVNDICREDDMTLVSIHDPVALYINKFNTSRFTLNGTDISDIPGVVTWTRGEPPKGLRVTIQIPQNHDRNTVSDIYDVTNRMNIKYGAQFADAIEMGISAVTTTFDAVAIPERCPCDCEERGIQDGYVPYKVHRAF